MAEIACLGWGSQIWNAGGLLVAEPWHEDGPVVRVEFLRKSANGRLTLVLDETAEPVPSLWSKMTTNELPTAIESLRIREGVSKNNETRDIGVWRRGEHAPLLIPNLSSWAERLRLEAVMFTTLGRKFHEDGRAATAADVLRYLDSLDGTARESAEEYVRRAPPQIDTAYRRRIVAALGWTVRT
jgi:hypothetical protein